jgi:4a-hydroxytetrahydrobiopterin dehydratase
MNTLAQMKCSECAVGAEPIRGEEISRYLAQLDGWEAVNEHHITKTFRFKNFAQALAYVNRVGQLAEEQGHHPDIYLAWGRVRVELWTHKVGGLSQSDFIMAAKVDLLPRE